MITFETRTGPTTFLALMVGLAVLGYGLLAFCQSGHQTTSAVQGGLAAGPLGTVSCRPGLRLIPGGTFLMGSPVGEGTEDERPAHRVSLSPFCMDETEVTVDAYALCVAQGRCTPPTLYARACTWGFRQTTGNYPINCVTWEQARNYCTFRGAQLPTEAQWEFAARGGAEQRRYSWGNEEPGTQLCWSGNGRRRTGPCSVRQYPSGAFGLFDMTGNVYEWTADWGGSYYNPSIPEIDPTGSSHSVYRICRGGAWDDYDPSWVRGARRHGHPPTYHHDMLGFRCAAAVINSPSQ